RDEFESRAGTGQNLMATRFLRAKHGKGFAAVALGWGLLLSPTGCVPSGDREGEGPGHRPQVLALSPEEELEVGREAYREILAQAEILPSDDPATQRVQSVGRRIVTATQIRPLLQEINLREDGYGFEWEFHVLESDRINAFCLPAGKVGVFTGL